MNAIKNVFAAFGNLAASINALAGVVDAVSAKVRQSVALDDGPLVIEQAPSVADTSTEPKRGKKASAA